MVVLDVSRFFCLWDEFRTKCFGTKLLVSFSHNTSLQMINLHIINEERERERERKREERHCKAVI